MDENSRNVDKREEESEEADGGAGNTDDNEDDKALGVKASELEALCKAANNATKERFFPIIMA